MFSRHLRWLALLLAVYAAAAVSATSRDSSRRSVPSRGGGSVSNVGADALQKRPLQIFLRTILDARRHLMAAAVARSTSIFAMYPVDTIKTRLQMQQAHAFRLNGLFNGVGGSLAGQVPYGVLTFGSYEMYKTYLLDRFPIVNPIFKYAAAAIMGDLTGSGWLCELDISTR